jgi:choline-glycine betaine transporter
MKNIVASWKTTLLGLLIIGAGIAYIFVVQDSKVFQFAILLIIGIGFLFAPDTIIDGLRSIIKNNKDKKF